MQSTPLNVKDSVLEPLKLSLLQSLPPWIANLHSTQHKVPGDVVLLLLVMMLLAQTSYSLAYVSERTSPDTAPLGHVGPAWLTTLPLETGMK